MQNQKVKLSELKKKNLLRTFLWLQDLDLRKNFLLEKKITINSHFNWYKNYLNDKTQKIFAISYNKEHVGNIGLKDINNDLNCAEIWIYIGEKKNYNKGIGSISIGLIKKYCFEIGISKLYCFVAEFNIASINMFKKAGFEIKSVVERKIFKKKVRVVNLEIIK